MKYELKTVQIGDDLDAEGPPGRKVRITITTVCDVWVNDENTPEEQLAEELEEAKDDPLGYADVMFDSHTITGEVLP